jgi:glycosyltransferase involved in cell wall biosynthesis
MKKIKVSVIVSTYNWPKALYLTLSSLILQDYKDFEIIVADDGSSTDTRQLIDFFCKRNQLTIKHVWQEDKGFRAARIRNKAVLQSSGEYVIFLDGDCFVRHNFITRHVNVAEKNYFVSGNRILCNKSLSSYLLLNVDELRKGYLYWLKKWLHGDINRFYPLLTLPSFLSWRKWFKTQWKGAKTCNLGVFRNDLYRVNGFDERFIGWGYEDSDLVIRLIRANILHKSGRFYLPVFHLWHPLSDRKSQDQNKTHLQQTINSNIVAARKGLSSHR